MTLKNTFALNGFKKGEDITLFCLRVFVGIFLMLETWDNIISPGRMAEFVGFMAGHGFAAPHILAPLSVWAQFICGGLLVLGALTRAAALILVLNFIVAFVMVHLSDPLRGQFPALILVFVTAYFATHGGGRFALDRFWFKNSP